MDSFWNLVDVKGDEECWNFIGKSISRKGYGVIRRNHKSIRSHRYAYFLKHPLAVGNVNELKLHCLHKCDNRRCCNPNHLFLGTNYDNVVDKVEKERQARGESHGMSRLTEAQVREIREKWGNKKNTQNQLANEYGLKNKATISAICCRRRWKYLL
jgi:hypothetical protein